MEKIYPKGIYANKKRDNAPDFVIGGISIKKYDLVEWLEGVEENEKGYINLDMLEGKDGPYLVVNTWKPTGNKESETVPF